MKTLTIFKNKAGFIYLIDSEIVEEENEANFVMVWEKSEILFNDLKEYQNKGYTIIFK